MDDNPPDALDSVRRVKADHEAEILAKPNVIGVGVGLVRRAGRSTAQIGIIVMVERKVPGAELAPAQRVPAEIEGVRVDVQEVGEVRAHD